MHKLESDCSILFARLLISPSLFYLFFLLIFFTNYDIILCKLYFFTALSLYLQSDTGQFWNVPIKVVKTSGVIVPIQVNDVQSNKYRSFCAFRSKPTWDGTGSMCYYTPRLQRVPTSDSVIEGIYTQYQTDSLFATDFFNKQFDDEKC